VRIDGFDGEGIAAITGSPTVRLFDEVESTMDEAHRLAADLAPSGTVVIADSQRRGRGRMGREWASRAGAGLWMTMLGRPQSADVLDVLSLRVGIAIAAPLDQFAGSLVAIKWPNDLLVNGSKLAGILVEARWHGASPDWVAVGVGINMAVPVGHAAFGLGAATSRSEVLRAVVPSLRAAIERTGPLTAEELDRFAERDALHDAILEAPARGRANGISATGALRIVTEHGEEFFRRGSPIVAESTGTD